MKKIIMVLLLVLVIPFSGCGRTNTYINDNSLLNNEICYEINEPERVPETTPAFNVQENPLLKPQNVVLISAGAWHTLAVTADGGLWAWGGSDWQRGLIGDGTNGYSLLPVRILSNVTYAVAGESHSMAITADGALWAWGNNHVGQIGDGTHTTPEWAADWLGIPAVDNNRLTPVKIKDNVVYVTIAPTYPNAHASYSQRSFAITADGTLWAWGENGGSIYANISGYLGDGTNENQYLPVMILENVVSVTPTLDGGNAITADGAQWGWGANWRGQVGDGTTETRLRPVMIEAEITAPDTPEYIPLYWRRPNFELDGQGILWAWGRNIGMPYDQLQLFPPLGDGTTEYRYDPVKIMENVASFITPFDTAYAITKDGTLWAWGNNRMGQLGDGTTEPRLAPVKILENVASIYPVFHEDHGFARFVKMLALTECGAVWAWGGGGFSEGRIGDGTREHRLYPVLIIDGRTE